MFLFCNRLHKTEEGKSLLQKSGVGLNTMVVTALSLFFKSLYLSFWFCCWLGSTDFFKSLLCPNFKLSENYCIPCNHKKFVKICNIGGFFTKSLFKVSIKIVPFYIAHFNGFRLRYILYLKNKASRIEKFSYCCHFQKFAHF